LNSLLFSIFVEQHWRDPNVLVVGNLSALCPGENRGFFYGRSQGYMLNIFLAMHIARFFQSSLCGTVSFWYSVATLNNQSVHRK
jgi:hypothetical protein